jgi:hypothetical protein
MTNYIMIYLAGVVVTALAFVALETRRPARIYLSTYPDGKAYNSFFVWYAGAFMGLIWPAFWPTAGVEMVGDQFRKAAR